MTEHCPRGQTVTPGGFLKSSSSDYPCRIKEVWENGAATITPDQLAQVGRAIHDMMQEADSDLHFCPDDAEKIGMIFTPQTFKGTLCETCGKFFPAESNNAQA